MTTNGRRIADSLMSFMWKTGTPDDYDAAAEFLEQQAKLEISDEWACDVLSAARDWMKHRSRVYREQLIEAFGDRTSAP